MTTSTYLSSEDKAWAARAAYPHSIPAAGLTTHNAYLRAFFYAGVADMHVDYSDLYVGAEAEMDAAWDIGRAWAVRDFDAACAAFTEWMADQY